MRIHQSSRQFVSCALCVRATFSVEYKHASTQFVHFARGLLWVLAFWCTRRLRRAVICWNDFWMGRKPVDCNISGLCVVCDSDEEEEDYVEVEKGIVIELITLKNPHIIQNLSHANISSIGDTHYNASLPTRVFVHGWQSKGEFKNHLIRGVLHLLTTPFAAQIKMLCHVWCIFSQISVFPRWPAWHQFDRHQLGELLGHI